MSMRTVFWTVAIALLGAGHAFAQILWQQYEGNPILTPTASWEMGNGLLGPRVLKVANQYKMWYSGLGSNWQLGFATSEDGIHWTKSSSNPVLRPGHSGDFDSQLAHYGAVLFHEGQYWMWYSGHNGSVWQIGLAASPDGINWTKHSNNPVLGVGSGAAWDALGVIAPAVVFDGHTFRMWYNGNGSVIAQACGYAESTDGMHWQKYEHNPVFTPVPSDWESRAVGVNSVMLHDGLYHAWYGATSGAVTNGFGYATSSDGIVWQRYANNPVMLPGENGGWDSTTLGGFSVMYESNMFKMWFSGRSDDVWKIGYATSLPSDAGNYALQFDGVDDRVSLPKNFISTPSAITMEAWVKYTSHKGYMQAVSLEGAYAFYLNRFATGTFTPFFDGGSIHENDRAYGANLNDNQWHHLAAVHDDNTLQVYIDGVFAGAVQEILFDLNTLDRASAIGSQFDGSEFHFEGTVDEVRVWNVARTAADIQANMHQRLTGNEPGLMGYWRLDEGEGQFAQDSSPSGLHGHLGSVPQSDASDPRWVLANRAATGCSGIPLPAAAAYGNLNNQNQTHSDKVTYCFPGQTRDKYLTFEVFDIDQSDEVDVLLNGAHILNAPVTANNGWSGLIGVLLSDAQMHDEQSNELIFDNRKNPPSSWRWGVRRVSVDPFYALPSPAAYGKIPGGDQAHADKVVYFFSGQPGDLNLRFEAYDVDQSYEVDVVLNGAKIHDVAITPNESWSEARTRLLPDDRVYDQGINVLIFENTQNPPREWLWGVRNVSVAAASGSSVSINSTVAVQVSGSGLQDGQYLLDGRSAPLARPQGDDGAPSDPAAYVIEGATTITPNGYAMVEFPSTQRFDYLALYPEWHAHRYFSYRVETSMDGSNWRTAVDHSETFLHGVQLVALPTTTRFVRLAGTSCVINVDSLQALSLSEEGYWQAHASVLQQAVPADLALAEVAFIQTRPTVDVKDPIAEPPAAYHLAQNVPNPFNLSTQIRFDLPAAGQVQLAIYNLRGELVRTLVTGELPAGTHAFTFDGSGLASGVYLYRMQAGGFVAVRKMLLAK
ncbi:MAG: LamG-like jellyroll fold domain-containing protein [bacterium]